MELGEEPGQGEVRGDGRGHARGETLGAQSRLGSIQGLDEAAEHRVQAIAEEGEEERFLGGKVEVERALGDAEARGELCHLDLVEAFFREQGIRPREDLAPPRILFVLSRSSPRHNAPSGTLNDPGSIILTQGQKIKQLVSLGDKMWNKLPLA